MPSHPRALPRRAAAGLLALLALTLPPPLGARAVRLIFANGDRLTGELVGEDAETFLVRTPLTPGELRLPKAGTTLEELDDLTAATPLVDPSAESRLHAPPQPGDSSAPAAAAPTITPADTTPTPTDTAPADTATARAEPAADIPEAPPPDNLATAALDAVGDLAAGTRRSLHGASKLLPILELLLQSHPLQGWKNRVSAGYSWTSQSSSREQAFLRLASRRHIDDVSDFTANLVYEWGRVKDEGSARRIDRNRLHGDIFYRQDWSRLNYLLTNNRYRHDQVADVDHEISNSFGIGFKAFPDGPLQVSVAPAITIEYRAASADSGWTTLAGAFGEGRIQFTRAVALVGEGDAAHSIGGAPYVKARATSRLEVKHGPLTYGLRYSVDFDDRADSGLVEADHRIFTDVGYDF